MLDETSCTPPLTGSGTVKVVVQDVNDHSPEFERQTYAANILENTPVGSFVIQPVARDFDAGLNAKIKYSFLGEKSERFHLDESTGTITTATVLDREETSVYFLTFVAQDCSPTEPRATAVNLTINVLDDNDNSPKFDRSEYTVYVPDNTPIGQFVFGAKAHDSDVGKNSQIKYHLRGKDSGKFSIAPETGVIKTAKELSPQGDASDMVYNMEVIAEDGGKEPQTASAKLTVKIRPRDWFPKIVTPTDQKFTLPENTITGNIITKLSAVSARQDTNGRIQYAIAGGNVGDALKVDVNTGEVIVAGGRLDYETSPIYEVWVEAHYVDEPSLRTVIQLVINVTDTNDNPPVIEQQMYNASIYEEEYPPLRVCIVKAGDLDSGSNGQITYRLIDSYEGTFGVNEETGEISTETKLDRETADSYSLIVEALDHGTPQLTGTTTVLVTVLDKNDNPPRFTRLFSANITENAELGSFVIRVTSSDQDIGENANATYSFTENPGSKFHLDPLTGNVTVAGLLDRETQDEYLLKVAAFDGAWRSETPLTITIQDQNDNAPQFEHSYYNFNFPELQMSFVFVGQVVASDKDKHGPNSVISYSLKHPSDLFTIDPATGELFSKRTMRYKYTALELSPENQYTLTVLATDNGKPPMSSECLVTVNVVDSNNNPPKFNKTKYFSPVPKMSQIGLKILQVAASDANDYGINSEIEYEIYGGNGSEYFLVDKKTGWITVSRSVLPIPELTKFYLTIRAKDKGVPPLDDTTIVELIITGDNLHTPVFPALSFQVIIPENDPVGSTILTVVATDNDDGPNGMIEYKISSGNEDSKFGINRTTGALQIFKPLDYDTVSSYHLNVTATDLGFESRQATAMITVALTDINDNPPRFNQTEFHAYISENSPPGTLVYRVQALDSDSEKNAVVRYSITRGSGKDVFTIDAITGQIYSKTELDYEEKNEYDLEVLAANPESPMFGITRVIVHVTGVNEFYPKFVRPVFHFEISESSEVGTSVGTVEATDADAGDDAKVYYLFVGSSNDKGFSIGSETGVILVSRRLDRETQSRVVLTVVAKNAGGIRGNDTEEAQVIISIQDGNDPPEFIQREYEARVSEAIRPGKTVMIVKAVDTDVRPQNNQFSYSIISGNVGKAFKIDPQTGIIETTTQLDREKVPAYTLVVGAIDVGVPPQTGTTVVRILLDDVNDNGPTFDPSNVVGYVTENEPPNTSIMTLSATDPDLPPNGAPFSYYIVGGKSRDFVYIEKSTGVLKTKKVIDREANPQLDIIVGVEDSGVPKMRSEHPVSVVVLDQNDSPSTPRTVRVLVHYFNDDLPTGKIADVHPNDADAIGEYHCKIVNGPTPRNALHIKHGCELTPGNVSPDVKYTLSVSGNDGKHSDVVSKVSVEFFQFSNSSVDHGYTIRIDNMTSVNFLTNHYKSFMDTAKSAFDSKDQIHLFSVTEVGADLDLTMVTKNSRGSYYSKERAVENLVRKRDTLQQMMASTVTVGYSPCGKVSCENGGVCSDGIEILEGTRIIDTQSVIFTSPLVSHDYTCRCPDGFTGKRCDRQHDPCSPNPCQAGGMCRRQGYDFQCSCPTTREGKLCERERGNVCDGNPCRNGGTCQQSPDGSSFFCLCRPGYRGNHCETVSDSCRPNPCLNGGICISLKPGYRCSCPHDRYGRHCEKSTFGFNELSYMAFPPLDVSTNDISIIFATIKPNALLVYNFGIQTGGRSDFVAVELIDGKAVFSYGGARSAITSVSVPRGNVSLANGEWHKITATRNGKVISLSVATCTENGDVCQECKTGDTNCFADDIGPTGTLNFNNHPMLVGGLMSTDPVLERPGQIHSDDLVGCVHSISINGRALNLSNPISSKNVDSICGRNRSPCAGSSQTNEVVEVFNPCGEGQCLDRWKSHQCICSNLVSADCNESLEPITLLEGSFVEFKISEKHIRMQLLESFYHGTTLWNNQRWKRYARPGSASTPNDILFSGPPKTLSLKFRTVRKEGLLLYSTTNKDFTSIELRNGNIVYVSRTGTSSPVVNMTVTELMLSDGNWHNLTLHSHNRGVRLIVDGKKAGEELDSEGVHDFLDPYLTSLSIGGARKELFQPSELVPLGFEGCITNFTINNEIQSFNGSGSIFTETIVFGKILKGCTGPVGMGAATAPDPLSIGVTLVIVFFVTLLVAILVSFIVFHLRRQKKEKIGSPVGRGTMGISKQNGGATLVAGGDGLVGATDGVLGRGLHGEANVGYLAETADALRGHHLVAPELISKKYREREILGSDTQRHPRPDIIEREVVSKSPLLREEHSPSPPNQVRQSPHNHDGSEIPEHYDLENASSIAPSDTDIVYHYKGYRDGGIRKYKQTPPHIPSGRGFHHKHAGTQQQQQHRHSPRMSGGFPPPTRDSPRSVVPPPPVSRVDSPQSVVNSLNSKTASKLLPHQSTPLARLSPSSELSSQQPRILTLSDISGKPLQSALLATTSSSGGVGKDILHSNSERSLNSPVTSQLSGQSSSASRKNQVQVEDSSENKNVPMGLTAEEIGRLNCHPRTSSLVSTLDAVSSSSEAPRPRQSHHLANTNNIPDNASSTTTDESGNDSFTCSEIEYDNNSLNGDKRSDILFSKLTEDEDGRRSRSNNSGTASKPPLPPPSYDGFDSSFRGSLSTLVASDDELSTHMGGLLYRGPNGSPSSTAALGWDYLLNWGPNFESLVGVFKDIAELPDAVNGRGQTLRLPSQSPKPNEEYV
ncbi:hypothetical protein RUM43_009879 [Polyplax serrata]|uniref:Cadherin n=1 Tax=Polyplax serrata TaxID=468196 RepID=A0AAN8S6X9_POLSC